MQEIFLYFLTEMSREGAGMQLLLSLFPYFLLLELPLNLVVMLGVLRWFTRKVGTPKYSRAYSPRVSCVITCYGEGKDVVQTLRSLTEQVYPGHIEMVPVVDGASMNRHTLDAVRSFKIDRRLHPKRHLRPIAKWQRGGRVSSLNAGLAHATGEIVMALDGDTSFDNNMVSSMVRHFSDPSVPAVAGSLRVRNASVSLTTRMQAIEYLISIHMSKIGLAEWNVVNNISGAFGAFRRSFLKQIGGWNTHTAEDLDITLRIKNYSRRHDIRIPFEPEAIGHTDAPTTFRGFLQQRLRWDGDLYFLYMRKHRHSVNPRLIGWPNFLMLLISGMLFQMVLPFVIIAYMGTALVTLPLPSFLFLCGLVYLLYFGLTVFLYAGMLLMVSERPRRDLRLIPFLPLFPIFMMVMRCWSAVAMVNEFWRRGHEESGMAPWWVLKRATKF